MRRDVLGRRRHDDADEPRLGEHRRVEADGAHRLRRVVRADDGAAVRAPSASRASRPCAARPSTSRGSRSRRRPTASRSRRSGCRRSGPGWPPLVTLMMPWLLSRICAHIMHSCITAASSALYPIPRHAAYSSFRVSSSGIITLPSSDVAGGGGEVAAPFQNWRAPPQQWRGDSAAAVYSDRLDVSWRARWSSIASSSRRRKMQQCRSPMSSLSKTEIGGAMQHAAPRRRVVRVVAPAPPPPDDDVERRAPRRRRRRVNPALADGTYDSRGAAFGAFGAGKVPGADQLRVARRAAARCSARGRRAVAPEVAAQSTVMQPFIYLPTFAASRRRCAVEHPTPRSSARASHPTLQKLWACWTPAVIFAFARLPHHGRSSSRARSRGTRC